MTVRRQLREAEATGRAYAHQTDRNMRPFSGNSCPYWMVVHDWAFADEWQKMKAEHGRLHGKADDS